MELPVHTRLFAAPNRRIQRQYHESGIHIRAECQELQCRRALHLSRAPRHCNLRRLQQRSREHLSPPDDEPDGLHGTPPLQSLPERRSPTVCEGKLPAEILREGFPRERAAISRTEG